MSRKSLVPIELPADPTQPLEAVTKQYVDTYAVAPVISVNDETGAVSTPRYFTTKANMLAWTPAKYGAQAFCQAEGNLYQWTDQGWWFLAGANDPTYVRAYQSANATAATGWRQVIPNTEGSDFGNNFASGAYTVPRPGLLEVQFYLVNSAAADMQLGIQVGAFSSSPTYAGPRASSRSLMMGLTFPVSKNEVITLYGYTATSVSFVGSGWSTYGVFKMVP